MRDDERFMNRLYAEERGASSREIRECLDNITLYLEKYNQSWENHLGKMGRHRLRAALNLLLSQEKSEVDLDALAIANKEVANAEIQLEKDTIKQMAANAKKESMMAIEEVEEDLEDDLEDDKKIFDDGIDALSDL